MFDKRITLSGSCALQRGFGEFRINGFQGDKIEFFKFGFKFFGSLHDSSGMEANGHGREGPSLRAQALRELQNAEFNGHFGFKLLEKGFPQRAVTLRQIHIRVMV